MTKGQVAYEFLFLFFTLAVAFTVWIMFTASAQEDLVYEERERHLVDFGLQLQNDLYTAAQMPDGFSRELEITHTLGGYDYTIRVDQFHNETYAIIRSGEHRGEFRLPQIEGDLRRGRNRLKVVDGVLEVNQ